MYEIFYDNYLKHGIKFDFSCKKAWIMYEIL